MTPAEFRRDVLPRVQETWLHHCFCANPAFARLVALDLGAAALADAQILISEIIEKRFVSRGVKEHPGGQSKRYACPKCGAECSVVWDQFSINMERTYVEWTNPPAFRGVTVPYLVGFYGHNPPNHVDGFERVGSPDEFLAVLSPRT